MTVPFVQIFPVFDADSPNLARALLLASEELIFWVFWIGAIAILQVWRNAITICLFGKMPL